MCELPELKKKKNIWIMLSERWSDFFFLIFIFWGCWFSVEPGVRLSDPYGSLLTQDILLFCDTTLS